MSAMRTLFYYWRLLLWEYYVLVESRPAGLAVAAVTCEKVAVGAACFDLLRDLDYQHKLGNALEFYNFTIITKIIIIALFLRVINSTAPDKN